MLTFRVADDSDSAALIALVTSAYRGESSRAGWTTEADLLDGPRISAEILADDLANPDGRVLVAADPAAPESLVACCNVVRRPDGTGYFGMFAVSPVAQGAGLGKAVLAEAERIARDEWSLTAMEMTVIEQRGDLIAFYERRGYVRTGAFSPFPYGDERVGIPKRDDLRMVVLRKPL